MTLQISGHGKPQIEKVKEEGPATNNQRDSYKAQVVRTIIYGFGTVFGLISISHHLVVLAKDSVISCRACVQGIYEGASGVHYYSAAAYVFVLIRCVECLPPL